jgi:UDP-N-acetylmuramate dehydrogenase
VHERQALVLVNRDGASGQDILQLAERIKEDVALRFGVKLEIEPVVI